MYMNKFLIFSGISALLVGCGGNNYSKWNNSPATSNPRDVQTSYIDAASLYGSDFGGNSANIAVLLPMKGAGQNVGKDIKAAIETALLRKPNSNVKVSFYDLSGNREKRNDVIKAALYSNPDMIIGPLFAEDTKILRDSKPSDLPVLSFTSDMDALGRGVSTLNLMPTQSIETIVRQIQSDGASSMIILAPDDNSGKLMTAVANKSADLYNVSTKGIFYYTPGKPDSIKEVAMQASVYQTRNAVNTRAREVLSDILAKEEIDDETRENLTEQLEKISRTETTGELPYDSILFLGNAEDSKTLASFLRYYGVGNRDAAFYGTTLWQNSSIASDFNMSGSKYATLPDVADNFVFLYNTVSGKNPDHLAAFGYDAANLAMGMIYSQKSSMAYLYDPSGFSGASGIFRIQPSGESERALRIMELNGSGQPTTVKESPMNFFTVLYNVRPNNVSQTPAKELSIRGINPGDYIEIPEEFKRRPEYRMRTIGADYSADAEEEVVENPENIQVFAPEEEAETVSNPEFKPVKLETVSRQLIDSVEVAE